MNTKIILIRHGETEYNNKGIFRGRMDVELNENGKEQAHELAQELEEQFDINKIYTSPLIRSKETAVILGEELDLEVVEEDGFNNIDLGNWQGTPKEEIKTKFPNMWKKWVYQPEELEIPSGETLNGILKRVKEAINRTVGENKGKTIAIVSHRSILKVLIAYLLGIKQDYFWKFRLENCSYSIFNYSDDRGYMLTLLNQYKHLPDFVVENY